MEGVTGQTVSGILHYEWYFSICDSMCLIYISDRKFLSISIFIDYNFRSITSRLHVIDHCFVSRVRWQVHTICSRNNTTFTTTLNCRFLYIRFSESLNNQEKCLFVDIQLNFASSRISSCAADLQFSFSVASGITI